jgi:dephospho-CoA kinase
MYKIGLTGGIGSGKSKVADMLGHWGAAIVDTDVIAHELTAPGGQAIEPIRQHFGPGVISATGALDRQAMLTQKRAEAASGCYLVFVVPLLVESGRWRDRVNRICVVDCDPETQLHRVQARSGLTPQAIERIMSAQATREARLAVADDIVLNDGRTDVDELARRVRELHDDWCARARQAGRGSQSIKGL